MLSLAFASVAAALAVFYAVWQPIKTRRVRDGWKPKKFSGTHSEFVAKYRRQFAQVWLWVTLGAIFTLLGLLDISREGRHWWQVVAGVAYLIIGVIGLWCRRILGSSPTTRAGTPAA
jgi:hypothetical protein